MIRAAVAAIISACFLVPWATAADGQSRHLTLEERIDAQKALERVYHSHLIGDRRRFDQAVPRELLERKVRTYLKLSVALERFWATPVTADMLQREARRMAGGTRMPERLAELHAALGNDPVLILECLARASLVERLSRNFYVYDDRFHKEARASAEGLRRSLLDAEIDPEGWDPRRTVVEAVRSENLSHTALSQIGFDRLLEQVPSEAGSIGPLKEDPEAFQIWVTLDRRPDRLRAVRYRIPKVTWDDWWASVEDDLDLQDAPAVTWERIPLTPEHGGPAHLASASAGAQASCPPNDTWDNGTLDATPDGRVEHTTVWTGSHMIVWGGYHSRLLNSGGRYDPTTDTWSRISTLNAPQARRQHTAIWTGSEMIIWGGCAIATCSSEVNTGGRYELATDTWTPVTITGAPPTRRLHSAVWTGSRMIVWGGISGTMNLASGSLYDPATDAWSATGGDNAPTARYLHTTVWTGSEMIVWGGRDTSIYVNTGGRYDPATDTWAHTSLLNAPPGRRLHSAIWTGTRMIVWGGDTAVSGAGITGGRYDPVADAWSSTSTLNAPTVRSGHGAVWTGSLMVVWGGNLDTGGRYDPAADTWTPTSTINAPAPTESSSTIWSGSHMIVWGGFGWTNLGGRYDPVADTWTPVVSANGPSARENHTAVWTGNQMIVWGGSNGSAALATGSRYDPAIDSWSPTSLTNAPSARDRHTAIWTGVEMIVWGGGAVPHTDSGGRYDPLADTWTPTRTAQAPKPRYLHNAVWTGSEMIVWGGLSGDYLKSGGRYDPVRDRWRSMSTSNAPAGRYWHSSVWTGSRMIVWGGYAEGPITNTGGLYDPATDTWTPTTTTGAPHARILHTGLWTGNRMILWGGTGDATIGTGSLYDPVTDTWRSTSTVNAPPKRDSHTAVWTGNRMIVWGGRGADYLNSGGLYDPAADTWIHTSTNNAPHGRFGPTGVWTGSLLIVWGGSAGILFDSGGRYVLFTDDDGDGATTCNDCDDADPATYPGAPQACDGRNNDCLVPGWPSPAGTNEIDDDEDGSSECQGDCDDTSGSVWATPSEARNLEATYDAGPGITHWTWEPPLEPGGDSVLHDLLGTGDATDFTGGAFCVGSDGASVTFADPSAPPPGGIQYHLVRSENFCPSGLGAGPLGFRSDGTPIGGRSCP